MIDYVINLQPWVGQFSNLHSGVFSIPSAPDEKHAKDSANQEDESSHTGKDTNNYRNFLKKNKF